MKSWRGLKADTLHALPPPVLARLVTSLDERRWAYLETHWPFWSHRYQDPPAGDWGTWLLIAGRGAGKTKAGAEWVNGEVAAGRAGRIGLIGETMHDARSVMVEGKSGVLFPLNPAMRPVFEPSLRRLRWTNGATALVFSAEDPEQLRGPEFDLLWADEFAKWNRPQAALDMAMMCLRIGARPRLLITTTPRSTPALKALLADAGNARTHAPTVENAGHLSPDFIRRIRARYGGQRLGRQELEAELLADDETALWQRRTIDAARVFERPALRRVVVGVDPPVTSGRKADACGIVVAGQGESGDYYVLADRTVQGVSPSAWAERVADTATLWGAYRIAVETNQGGELITQVLRQTGRLTVPIRTVTARLAKTSRAAPVAALYEQGRVHHVGSLSALEDEMCLFGGADAPAGSPDRVDALVWAVTELLPLGEGFPRIRGL